MKKLIIVFTLILFSIYTLQGQEFESGTNVITVNIGLGGNFGSFTTSSQGLGYGVGYERGIWDAGPGVVSLGGYVGYKSFKNNDLFFDDTWNYIIIGVRGAYHYTGLNVENLDVYGGLMLSYNILSFDGVGVSNFDSRPAGTGFVGARWYFTESISASAEAGYGVAFLSLGASYRF